MADYFVDSTTGDNADNGTTFDLAWATVEYAHESGGLSAGDIVWVRPLHSEIPTSDIACIYDGTASSPLKTIGWPRAAIPNTTITQADFTNGSKIIDNVVGITPAREGHTNRYITAPDGKQYHITAVIWEAGVEGMGAGDEFAVGEILTNATQTKEGKVWGFTDDLDTTGTLQYVRDSATAWVEDDNITSSGGGDAEIDAGGETAVGFIMSAEYAGGTVTGTDGKFQIDADPDYAMIQFSSTFTADAATDIITIDAHPYKLADCVRVVSTTALPAGLSADTDYYVSPISSTTVKLSTTAANAKAGTYINITDTGTGTHTLATIEDSTWTIKKTDWDADNPSLPLIDFNDGAFQFTIYADAYHTIKNIEFKDSADTLGILQVYLANRAAIEGCLFKQTASATPLFRIRRTFVQTTRVITEGSAAVAAQSGIQLADGGGLIGQDIAVFNCGYGVQLSSGGLANDLKRVNLGIEMANTDDDINVFYGDSDFSGVDVALGGANGYVGHLAHYLLNLSVNIGNYQKILGDHVSFFPGGALGSTGGKANVDVGDANAPSAASPAGSTTDLACFYPNVSGYDYHEDFVTSHVQWKIWATAAAETYTVYIQNNMGVTLNDTAAKDDIWLKLTYIDSYDDATEYTKTELFSTEIDILDRSDATDWDSLTIANHTPAVAGWAILELFVSKYVAVGQIYVDPKYV